MAVDKYPDEVVAIRSLLSDHPEGLSIRAISSTLGINRNSVAKYLDMLQMQGRVTVRRLGSAKVFSLSDKLPVAALMKVAKSHVIVFGQAMAVEEINEPFRELARVQGREIIGKNVEQLPFFLESSPELPRLIREGLKGNEAKGSGVLVLTDRSLPCTFTVSPVFSEQGSPGAALILDVAPHTDPQQCADTDADRSLIELDENEYICRFTPDGTLTYVNRAYCDLRQRRKAELIGHEWRPAVPDSEYKKIRKCFASRDPAHPVATLEFRAITPGGESRWQRWKFRGIFGPDGKVTGYQGIGQDVTELKKTEDALGRSADELRLMRKDHTQEIQDLNRQLYNEIAGRERADFQLQFTQFAMNNASYLIIWINREGRFVYMNKRAQQVLGYSYRSLIAKDFTDILAADLPIAWDKVWEAARKDGQYTVETAMKTADGLDIPVELVLNFLEFKEKQYCCCFARDITEKRRVLEALQAAHFYNRNLIEASLDPLVTINPDGTISDVNEAMIRVTGVPRDELISTDFSSYFTGADAARAGYERVFRDGTVKDYELTIRHRNGSLTPVLFNATVYRDMNGGVAGVFAAARDITGLKKAEEELRESEERYRLVVENSHDAIFIYRDDRLVYFNERTPEITGFTPDELMLMDVWNLVHPDDHKYLRDLANTSGAHGRAPTDIAVRILPKQGGIRHTEMTVDRVMLGGKPAILGMVKDITARTRIETNLRESEEKYRTLLENLPQKIFLKDTASAYISCNRNFADEIGIVPDAIMGKTDYDFFPADLADKYRADDHRIMDSGTVAELQEEYFRDGRRVCVHTVKVPVRDDAGMVSGILGIFWEIAGP